jgi:hypothetical protein
LTSLLAAVMTMTRLASRDTFRDPDHQNGTSCRLKDLECDTSKRVTAAGTNTMCTHNDKVDTAFSGQPEDLFSRLTMAYFTRHL